VAAVDGVVATVAVFPRTQRFVNLSTFVPEAVTADIQELGHQTDLALNSMVLGGLVESRLTYRRYDVDVLPQETLAYTLRYKLGLTGTKIGCNRGECGACTVLIDDIPNYSCSTLTHGVRAREVLTVEGPQAADGTLHPVQQAFVDELGPECGFCTPGQVMSAVGLLRANPNSWRREARLAMSGNLCRCGAYDHYLNGVMLAAERSS